VRPGPSSRAYVSVSRASCCGADCRFAGSRRGSDEVLPGCGLAAGTPGPDVDDRRCLGRGGSAWVLSKPDAVAALELLLTAREIAELEGHYVSAVMLLAAQLASSRRASCSGVPGRAL
jgi:hypothetical protein